MEQQQQEQHAEERLACRTASPHDLEQIVAFNAAMAEETEGLQLPYGTITAGVRAVLSGEAHAAYFLLERLPTASSSARDGAGGQQRQQEQQQEQAPAAPEVVAQLMITYEWSDWRAGVVWWIQSVYVPPQHRQQGYFRALYQAVRDEAKRARAVGLRLYADAANARAHAAYERLGMTSHYKVYEDLFTDY